jgi:hypothetical protein
VQRMRYFFQELPNIKSEAALTREVSKFKREYKEKFKSLFGNRCSSKTVAKDLIEWNAIIHDHVDFKQQDYAEKIHEYMWKLQKFPVKSLDEELFLLSQKMNQQSDERDPEAS